jgi:hypothetical protein
MFFAQGQFSGYRVTQPCGLLPSALRHDAHDFAGRTNEPGSYQGYVSDPGAEIQDPLTQTDACFPEKPFGVMSEPGCLAKLAVRARRPCCPGRIENGDCSRPRSTRYYHA